MDENAGQATGGGKMATRLGFPNSVRPVPKGRSIFARTINRLVTASA